MASLLPRTILKIPSVVTEGIFKSTVRRKLPREVGKGFVGLCHAMRIFLFLKGKAFVV